MSNQRLDRDGFGLRRIRRDLQGRHDGMRAGRNATDQFTAVPAGIERNITGKTVSNPPLAKQSSIAAVDAQTPG